MLLFSLSFSVYRGQDGPDRSLLYSYVLYLNNVGTVPRQNLSIYWIPSVQKISDYEAVHPIRDWTDLKVRYIGDIFLQFIIEFSSWYAENFHFM